MAASTGKYTLLVVQTHLLPSWGSASGLHSSGTRHDMQLSEGKDISQQLDPGEVREKQQIRSVW